MVDALLSVPVVAERLGLSEKTVRRLMRSGHLEFVQVSRRRVAVLESALDAYLRGSACSHRPAAHPLDPHQRA